MRGKEGGTQRVEQVRGLWFKVKYLAWSLPGYLHHVLCHEAAYDDESASNCVRRNVACRIALIVQSSLPSRVRVQEYQN